MQLDTTTQRLIHTANAIKRKREKKQSNSKESTTKVS